jgi:hypothetical protein
MFDSTTDYEDENYLTVLKHMMALQKEGKIKMLGVWHHPLLHNKERGERREVRGER